MGLSGVDMANTAVGVSPETFLLLLLQQQQQLLLLLLLLLLQALTTRWVTRQRLVLAMFLPKALMVLFPVATFSSMFMQVTCMSRFVQQPGACPRQLLPYNSTAAEIDRVAIAPFTLSRSMRRFVCKSL
jgi:hypothetical protein